MNQQHTPERDRESFLASVLTAGFSAPTQKWAYVQDFALYIPRSGTSRRLSPVRAVGTTPG